MLYITLYVITFQNMVVFFILTKQKSKIVQSFKLLLKSSVDSKENNQNDTLPNQVPCLI